MCFEQQANFVAYFWWKLSKFAHFYPKNLNFSGLGGIKLTPALLPPPTPLAMGSIIKGLLYLIRICFDFRENFVQRKIRIRFQRLELRTHAVGIQPLQQPPFVRIKKLLRCGPAISPQTILPRRARQQRTVQMAAQRPKNRPFDIGQAGLQKTNLGPGQGR